MEKPQSRFSMYLEICQVEPKAWTRNHYAIRVGCNVVSINLAIYAYLKLICVRPITGLGFKITRSNYLTALSLFGMLGLIGALQYISYIKLDQFIYSNYYSSEVLSQAQFEELYNATVISHKIHQELSKRNLI